MSDFLQPHGLQHARIPCPSLSQEFAQIHVHWVGDTIQPSHPLWPPSPPALNLSQSQGHQPAQKLQSINTPHCPSAFPICYCLWTSHTVSALQNKNHSHRKLTQMITWTTALCNSMKLWAMLCRATQDRWVLMVSSDKMWSTGERNGKPLRDSCPWTVWEGKMRVHWKIIFPGQ